MAQGGPCRAGGPPVSARGVDRMGEELYARWRWARQKHSGVRERHWIALTTGERECWRDLARGVPVGV